MFTTLFILSGLSTAGALALGSIISGGAGLIGSGIGAWSAAKQTNKAAQTQLTATRETNEANAKLAREQQAWSEQMVDKQNAYNSPVQQMARYQEAGLNPNLIYGNGVASAGLQENLPSYQRAEMRTPDVLSPGLRKAGIVSELAQTWANLAGQFAQARYQNAAAENMEQQTHTQSGITPEMVRRSWNDKHDLAQMQISEGAARTALVNKQALHEAEKMLLTRAQTVQSTATSNVLRKQVSKIQADISYLDSVIALNEGKLSLMEFEKRWGDAEMRESMARTGLIEEQTAAAGADNYFLGNYQRDLDYMQYRRGLSGTMEKAPFALGSILGGLNGINRIKSRAMPINYRYKRNHKK